MESPYQQLSQFDLLSKARDAYQTAYEQAQAEHPDFSDAQINMFLSGRLKASTDAPLVGSTRRWQLPTGDAAKNVDVINAGNGLVLAHNKLTGDTQVINPERKPPPKYQTIKEPLPDIPAVDAVKGHPAIAADSGWHFPLVGWHVPFTGHDAQPAVAPVAESPAITGRTRSYQIPIPADLNATPAAATTPTPAAPVFRIASPMGTSGFVGQNPRTESGFIGTPGGANLFRTTAQLNGQPAAAVGNVDAPKPKGVTVKDKATGKTFIYRGNPQDIPTDKYSIMQ